MTTIIGIPGSLRQGSFNAALLRAAAQLTPADCTLEVVSIRDIPLYNGDLETAEGIPAPVMALKERIANADGLLLATPEYNNGIPGVMKNAIDWLSRPPKDIPKVFNNRPVGLVGATPGLRGTLLAQTAWLQIFRMLGMNPWYGKLMYVAQAGQSFDDSGNLVDDELRDRLEAYMEGFTAFVRGHAS